MEIECTWQEQIEEWSEMTEKEREQIKKVIFGSYFYRSEIIDINLISLFKNLLEVYIKDIQITNVDTLKNCMKLRKVWIESCENITSISFLPFLPNLEELKLCELKITTLNTPNKCSNLKLLSFHGCRQLSELTGLQNLKQLETLDTNWTNIRVLDIPKEMKNLKKINAFNCLQLTQITGLENCYQLEQINTNGTQLLQFYCEQNQANDYQSNIFISDPETELVFYKIKNNILSINNLQENNINVKQVTILQCDCSQLIYQSDNSVKVIQKVIDTFSPSCLAITNCQNIDSICHYINNFTELKLIHNDIADLSFIRGNINLNYLKIEYCEQLTDINNITIMKQLKQLIIINTHAKDFFCIIGLDSLQQVTIINNHRQEADLTLKTIEDESIMQKKRLLLFKQIKQTRYQLRKDFNTQYELIVAYDIHNKLRVNFGCQLCVDIINKMLEMIE